MIKRLYSKNENGFFARRRLPLLLAGLILTAMTTLPRPAAAQVAGVDQQWLGSYTFADAARVPKRRAPTDMVPSVAYDITVERDTAGRMTATFDVNGVQIYEAYQCSVKTRGERVEFYHERFVADGARDLRRFKKGERLFALVKTQVGRQTKYLFEPAAYKIIRYEKAKQNQAIYFTRQ